MSDVTPDPVAVGSINISITESAVTYDSEFSIPEVIFWLDVIKAMILKKVTDDGTA